MVVERPQGAGALNPIGCTLPGTKRGVVARGVVKELGKAGPSA
jgi:hypothetical protein